MAKLINTLDNLIKEVVTAKDVHNAAKKAGIPWDNNKKFMKLSKEVTGKEHIDDMTSKEREKLIKKILKKRWPNIIKETPTHINPPHLHPWELEGTYVVTFEKLDTWRRMLGMEKKERTENNLKYNVLGRSVNTFINEYKFQELLETWLDPEPERFCTLEELINVYPEIAEKLWGPSPTFLHNTPFSYPSHKILNIFNKYGCFLVWKSKFGSKQIQEQREYSPDYIHHPYTTNPYPNIWDIEGQHIGIFEGDKHGKVAARGKKIRGVKDDKPYMVLEDGIYIPDGQFQELLDAFLDPEPERFCTIEEFQKTYPKLINIIWGTKYNDIENAKLLFEIYGCFLVWKSRFGSKQIKEEYEIEDKFPAQEIIHYWQNELDITDWVITTERISPEQVEYGEATEFIGIVRDFSNKTGVIYHDRTLYEEAIIHELVHVQQPTWSEDQVNAETTRLLHEKPFPGTY